MSRDYLLCSTSYLWVLDGVEIETMRVEILVLIIYERYEDSNSY